MLKRLITVCVCLFLLIGALTTLINYVVLPSIVLPWLINKGNTPQSRLAIRQAWYWPWSGIDLDGVRISATLGPRASGLRLTAVCPRVTIHWPWASLTAPSRLGLPVITMKDARFSLTNLADSEKSFVFRNKDLVSDTNGSPPSDGTTQAQKTMPPRYLERVMNFLTQHLFPFGALRLTNAAIEIRLKENLFSIDLASLMIEADWLKRLTMSVEAACDAAACPMQNITCRSRFSGMSGRIEGTCQLSKVSPSWGLPQTLAGHRVRQFTAKDLSFSIVMDSPDDFRLKTHAHGLTLQAESSEPIRHLGVQAAEIKAAIVSQKDRVQAHGRARFKAAIWRDERRTLSVSGLLDDINGVLTRKDLTLSLVPSFEGIRFTRTAPNNEKTGPHTDGPSSHQESPSSITVTTNGGFELMGQTLSAATLDVTARQDAATHNWHTAELRLTKPKVSALHFRQENRALTAQAVAAQDTLVRWDKDIRAVAHIISVDNARVFDGNGDSLARTKTAQAKNITVVASFGLLTVSLQDLIAEDVTFNPVETTAASVAALSLKHGAWTQRPNPDTIQAQWDGLNLKGLSIQSPFGGASGDLMVSGRLNPMAKAKPIHHKQILSHLSMTGEINDALVDLTASDNPTLRHLRAITNLTGRFEYTNGHLAVAPLEGEWEGLPVRAEGRLALVRLNQDPPQEGPQDLMVTWPELDLSSWMPRLNALLPKTVRDHPWWPQIESGRLHASLFLDQNILFDDRAAARLKGNLSDVETVVPSLDLSLSRLNGSIDCSVTQQECVLQDIRFVYKNWPVSLNGVVRSFSQPSFSLQGRLFDASVAIEGQQRPEQWLFSRIKILSGASLFEGSGRWVSDNVRPLQLNGDWLVRLEDLNRLAFLDKRLASLPLSGKIEGNGLITLDPTIPATLLVDGVFTVHSFAVKGITLDTAAVTLRPRDEVQTVILEIPLSTGRIECTGEVFFEPNRHPTTAPTVSSSPGPSWRSHCAIEAVSLQEILRHTPWKDKPYDGKVFAEARLAGLLNDPASVNGEGVFSVTEGRLWESSLLKGIWKILLLTPELSKVRFNALETKFRIQEKNLLLDELIVRAPALELVGGGRIESNGSLDLALKPIIKEIELIKSESLRAGASRVFSELTAGQILIRIQGPISRPKITKTLSKPGVVGEAGGMIVDTIKTLIEDILP